MTERFAVALVGTRNPRFEAEVHQAFARDFRFVEVDEADAVLDLTPLGEPNFEGASGLVGKTHFFRVAPSARWSGGLDAVAAAVLRVLNKQVSIKLKESETHYGR